jgi:hypothetical protein
MSFTSHTFTNLPLVHTANPNFLRWRLWLGLLLIRESPHSESLRTPRLPNSNFGRLPISWLCRSMTSGDSQVRDSRSSQVQDSWALRAQDSRSSQVQDSWASQVPGFTSPQVRYFGVSQVQDSRFRRFEIPENSFHEFHKTRRFESDRFSWIPQHLAFLVLHTRTSLHNTLSVRLPIGFRLASKA